MYLLTIPSSNNLHFHRPLNNRHVMVWNNTVWAQPSYRNTDKHLKADKLGGMTDYYREQDWNIWKSFLKWRFPWRSRRGCLNSLSSSQRHREIAMRAAEKLCTWNWPAVFELRANFYIWTNWRHEYAARLLSAIQNGGPRWWIFGSLEGNFSGIGCTMEAQTTVSNSVWSVY